MKNNFKLLIIFFINSIIKWCCKNNKSKDDVMKDYYLNLYTKTRDKYFDYLKSLLLGGEKKFVVTANTETFMLGEEDKEINDILVNPCNSVIADGIGIVKGAKINGVVIEERITGVDVAEFLLRECSENNKRVFIFGAKEEVLGKMRRVIDSNYSGIVISGMVNGYIDNKDEVFVRMIKETKPDVVLVALGVPLQEKLINRHIDEFDKGIFVGVGGSIDVLSGSIRRAPNVFIKTNTEWLYRIIMKPSRIKKFFKYNFKFAVKTLFFKSDREVL